MAELDDMLSGKPSHKDESADSDELTIAEVVAHYAVYPVKIPKGYGWKTMKCPFHNDSSASAGINHDKNRFRCHTGGCGIAGGPIDIIRKMTGLDYREACEQATNIFGKSDAEVSRSIRRPSKPLPFGRNRWKEILE